MLYAVALIGASVATFGMLGIVVGGGGLDAWAYVYSCRSRTRGLVHVAWVLVGFGLLSLLLPRPTGHSFSPAMDCQNNLKQILLALHNYHDTHGSFPPAYVADSQGWVACLHRAAGQA